MTINIPIETYKRLLEAKRILERIALSAHTRIPPGAIRSGISSADIDAARKIVAELRD